MVCTYKCTYIPYHTLPRSAAKARGTRLMETEFESGRRCGKTCCRRTESITSTISVVRSLQSLTTGTPFCTYTQKDAENIQPHIVPIIVSLWDCCVTNPFPPQRHSFPARLIGRFLEEISFGVLPFSKWFSLAFPPSVPTFVNQCHRYHDGSN